jgi:RNA polymerase sigma-70 factor (ECF subfamily)
MQDREARIEQWIREARSGSTDSLENLVRECRNYLLTIANRSLSHAVRRKLGASDLVQDTLVEAVRDFSDFQGDQLGELLAWLRGILLHNAANTSRHYEQTDKRDVSREVSFENHGHDVLQLTDTAISPLSGMASRELDSQLSDALSRLPTDMRLAIELRNRDRLSFHEIGVEMGRSADAVRKLWARAIEKLRTELGDIQGLSG